jgi:glutamate synthase (NADPH/NADH) large chain
MNGGVAYVFDESGLVSSVFCNKASVDLEPLFDPADQQVVHDLIVKHLQATASRRALWILENWRQLLPKIVKVFPHEYKRVLGIKSAAQYVPNPQPPVPSPQLSQPEVARSEVSRG